MRQSLEKQKLILRESIKLDSGKLIDSCEVAFKTYGKLNKDKSNEKIHNLFYFSIFFNWTKY